MFLAVFGTGVFDAVKGGETHENISEVVNGVLPFVTAFGGYVASFYFPQNGGGRQR